MVHSLFPRPIAVYGHEQYVLYMCMWVRGRVRMWEKGRVRGRVRVRRRVRVKVEESSSFADKREDLSWKTNELEGRLRARPTLH